MKTFLIKKYIDRLASLNDQLCFFQFNRNELNKRLNDFGSKAGELYTPDLFAENAMAPRINVTIKELSRFQKLNEKFTFGAYISTSYEVASYYLQDSLEVLKRFNPNSYVVTNDNQLEEKYFLTLNSSSCTLPSRELIDTIKYIRLRRNLFTHIADSISAPMKNLIQTQGANLNSYWSHTLNSLDFESTNVLDFGEEETIDILKLLRIIVETLDANLASNLSKEGIITFLAQEQFASKPQKLNTVVVKERTRKIKVLGQATFGVNLIDSDIEPIVSVIGRK